MLLTQQYISDINSYIILFFTSLVYIIIYTSKHIPGSVEKPSVWVSQLHTRPWDSLVPRLHGEGKPGFEATLGCAKAYVVEGSITRVYPPKPVSGIFLEMHKSIN